MGLRICGSYYPMGRCICAVHPNNQLAGGFVDPTTQYAGVYVPLILLQYPMDRRKAALDPTTQWTGGKLPWILLPNGPVYMCRGSY